MSIVRPKNIGIVSGPGSEYFTNKIIYNLKDLYNKRNERLVDSLSVRYSMQKEDVIKNISFFEDLSSPDIPSQKSDYILHVPDFNVAVKYTKFKNGEVKSEVMEPIRGRSIFIVYDLSNTEKIKFQDEEYQLSINDHLMILFTLVQAVHMAGAREISLVLPAYPYARQHKKTGREGLTAALVGQILESLSVVRIITLDIHSREIENAFKNMHLENLHASYECIRALNRVIDISSNNLVVVSPDTGAVSRNKFYANALHTSLAMIYKERDYSIVSKDAKHSNIKSINLLGDINGKDVIIADDMIATGGTLITAMRELKKKGAKTITAITSLPFFNGSASEDFDVANKEGVFDYIIGTNAVYQTNDLLSKKWFIQADISLLFAKVIMRLNHGQSIAPLLDNRSFVQDLINSKQASK